MIQPEVMIVVPCYNEAKRLQGGEFVQFADEFPGYNFLFVDDGSTDETAQILEDLAAARPGRLSVLKQVKNSGKAEAVRQGLLKAVTTGAPFAAFWDADLATPLEVIPYFMKAFIEQPKIEMVLGARVKLMGHEIQRKEIRHYLGRVFATAASLVLNLAVYDTQCGAKMFRVTDVFREIIQKPFCSRWIFDVELLARYMKRTGLCREEAENRIYELPLRKWRDVAGSKVKPGDFFKAFGELIRIYFANR